MNVQVNSFTYNVNIQDGTIDSAKVGLYGHDETSGDYVNAQIKVEQSDLAEGAKFLTANPADIVAIAKKKTPSVNYLECLVDLSYTHR